MNLEIYRRLLAGESLAFSLPGRSLWRLAGPDALRYLNGQVTADITHLADGQGCYASVCNAKGRMEGDLFITRRGDEFYLDAAPTLHESLGLRLERYLVADDAALEDLTDLWHLRHVFGSTPPPTPDDGFIVPRARFGLPGHDVWSPNPLSPTEEVDSSVVEIIRLEHGLPAWDAELTPTTLPPEGGPHLLAAISYTKGCYVGQETIARLKSVGHVNRTLVFLKSESAAFPEPSAKLVREGKDAGVVTSSGFSPTLERGIALAYIPRVIAEQGGLVQAGEIKLTIASAQEIAK